MLVILVILIVLAAIYFQLPFWLKLIILAINSFVPDPIPVLDEVLMIVAIINDIRKLKMFVKVVSWMRAHKILLAVLILGILFALLILIISCGGAR